MGIKLLTKFITDHSLIKPHKLRDSDLVIDGSHLCGWCCRKCNGDYTEYVRCMKQLFHNFAECNVRCHVVFHGGYSALQIDNKIFRLTNAIKEAAPFEWNSFFLKDIMTEVMDEMNVPYVTCDDQRTDETIVALAKHFDCPILTNESNFFISEAPCINYESCLRQPETDYVQCEIFKREEFLKVYPVRMEMLPIFSMLLNKNCVREPYLNAFFREHKIALHVYYCISGVLRWLSCRDYNAALNAIMRHVPTEKRQKCHAMLEASKAIVFGADTSNFAFKFLLESGSVIIKNNDPDWFEKGIVTRRIPAQYIDPYCRRSLTMDLLVEKYNHEDSFRPCLRIVRYAFDLLTGFCGSQFEYVGRRGSNIERLCITADLSVSEPERGRGTPFGSGWDVLPDYFGHFLRETLSELSSDALMKLPADCQLFMVALVWWKKYAARHAVAEVHSLLLCYLRGSVLRAKEDEDGDEAEAMKLLHRKLITKVDRAEASEAVNLGPDQDRVKYDKRLLHAFTQFRNVLKEINCLSQLCGAAYKPTRYHEVYCDRFAYYTCVAMKERADPEAFIADCMRETGTLYELYKRLQEFYKQCVEAMTAEVTPATAGAAETPL